MNPIDDINFDEHELMMVEAAALAIGAIQNEDGSLTMSVKQLMLLCSLAVQAAIEQMG